MYFLFSFQHTISIQISFNYTKILSKLHLYTRVAVFYSGGQAPHTAAPSLNGSEKRTEAVEQRGAGGAQPLVYNCA